MSEFPQYDDDGEEILFFPNLWRDIQSQAIVGTDCFLPFANINNGLNRFVLDVTGIDFTKMLSSLYVGAEIAYPQEFLQIIANFLKMVHCPIDFEEECQEYPTYTPIIQYAPMNPFNNPDDIPSGYINPPFVFVTEENIGEFPQNEVGDVVAVFNSFPLDTGWFDDLSGALPTITINVQGQGNLAIKFLNQTQGGLVIVTVDNPPNLVDILAGIITGADNIIDVNLDIVSLPPETATEHVFPVSVEGAGMHTIYCVFFPIIDDSLIPLRFGGGIRSIELCDFGEVPMNYVEDIRVNTEEYALPTLEKRIVGLWSPVTNWSDVMDLIGDAYELANAGFEYGFGSWERLDILEPRVDALEASQDAQDLVLGEHETRLDALESSLSSDVSALDARLDVLEADKIWSKHWDFKTSNYDFGSDGTYSVGTGFSFTDSLSLQKANSLQADGRIAYYRIELRKVGTGSANYVTNLSPALGSYGRAASGLNIHWHKAANTPDSHELTINFLALGGVSYILEGLTVYGYGTALYT